MTDVIKFEPRDPHSDDGDLPEYLVGRPTGRPPVDRWQVLVDMAYAMGRGRPGGGTDLDYLDEALRAFPMPAEHMAVADFEGYAVNRLLTLLRDRCLRRAFRGVRNAHGDC